MCDEEFKIYHLSSKEAIRKYVRENTNDLDGVQDEDIKQIETDYNNSIYVLIKDGTLYKDRKLIETNVDKLWMQDGFSLYAIKTDNTIKSITNSWNLHKYISDGVYEKVLTSPLYLVALTKDKRIKCIHNDPSGLGIVPDNFINVDDVILKTDLEIPYIIKEGKEMSLFISDNVED